MKSWPITKWIGKRFPVPRTRPTQRLIRTLNFEEMIPRVRSPERDSHGRLGLAHQVVRVNADSQLAESGDARYRLPPESQREAGSHVALFPPLWEEPGHFHGLGYARHND